MKPLNIFKLITFTLSTTLLIVTPTLAKSSNCVQERFTKISEYESIKKDCYLSSPLRLAMTHKNYPKLNFNPRSVQYWQGSYTRDMITTITYERELIDVCRGRIIKTDQINEQYPYKLEFTIVNPNLDDGISESFMLSPLTEQEAQNELVQSKQRCEESN